MPSLDKQLAAPPADLDQRVWHVDASDDPHVKRGLRLGFRPLAGTPGAWQLFELDASGNPDPGGAVSGSSIRRAQAGPFLYGSVDYRGHTGSTDLVVMFYALLLPRSRIGVDRIQRLFTRSGHGLDSDPERIAGVEWPVKLINHNGTWHGSGGGD